MQQTLRQYPALRAWLLLLPAGLYLLVFFLAPLVIVLVYSFLERGTYGGVIYSFTLENFQRVFDSLYFGTFLRSVYIAIVTTLVCLALGFPLAWFIVSRPSHQRNLLLLALMIRSSKASGFCVG